MIMARIFILRLAFLSLIAPLIIVNAKNSSEENINNLTNKVELQQIDNDNTTLLSGNDTNLTSQQTRESILIFEIKELEKQIQLTQTKVDLLKELRDHYLHDNGIIPVINYIQN